MTFAAERKLIGREAVNVLELDPDFCTRVADSADVDTAAGFNLNLATQSEDLDHGDWLVAPALAVTVASDVTTPPAGADQVWKITDNGTNIDGRIQEATPGGLLTDNARYVVSAFVKNGTSTEVTLGLFDTGGGAAFRMRIDFQWIAGVLSVKAEDVGTGGVVDVGGGWYRAFGVVPAGVVVGANTHGILLCPSEYGVMPGAAVYDFWTAAQFEAGTSPTEYQPTLARDGTFTNVTLTTGGRTIDADVGGYAIWDLTSAYEITRNGAGYLRLSGDASSEDLEGFFISEGEFTACRATETGDDKCYNTRRTCNALVDWDATFQTNRFAEPRANIPPTADAHATLLSVSLAPTQIRPGKGLGVRAKVTCVLQDVPHHDRGIDPYVSERTYVPEDQGTFWGKWLQRNVYYQGRPMRIKSGYISASGLDLTTDFETRTYVIEQINGPDANGKVTVIGKDVLKLADDERAQAPTPSTGVLDADINAGVGSLTLSPSGIGDSEYDSSGAVRIGSEVMTFTRAGDVLTITRGTDGTTAAAHSADDTVQQCLRYTDQEAHDVLEDLLLNFAGISAPFLPTSDWETEVETKLGPHSLTALITEPTGVSTLVNEIAASYLLYVWWDERDSEVKLAVIAPYSAAPTVLTDEANILADSVSVTEMPDERRSQVWVHYGIIDPTRDLEEATNYEVAKVRVDNAAESEAEYDDKRVERIYSRWITASGDAIRLGGRLLSSLRDNPRRVRFSLDAQDHGNWTGDIVTLDTAQLQDAAGANLQTTLRIIETRDDGHRQDCVGLDENFDGRYARIGPDSLPDYDGATDDQKRRYGWIAEDSAPVLNGDGAYKVG